MPGDVGLQMVVVRDEAALIGLDADGFEAEAFGERLAADGDEHDVGVERAAAPPFAGSMVTCRPCRSFSTPVTLWPSSNFMPCFFSDALEGGGDFGVHGRRDLVEEFDDGDFGAQAAPDAAELKADDAGADDDQLAGTCSRAKARRWS